MRITRLVSSRSAAIAAVALVSLAMIGCGSSSEPAPPVATALAFRVMPSGAAAGQTIAPAVQVELRDKDGAVVTTATNAVTLALGSNATGAALTGTMTASAVAGVATFPSLSVSKAGSGYTLVATSGTLTSATSAAFAVSAGAPTTLAFRTAPTNATAGQAFAPVVQVEIRDADGVVNTTATNAVTLALGANAAGATLTGTATVSAVAGVATFTGLSMTKSGTAYTLVASSGTLTNATSAAFAIAPGAPAVLAFSNAPPANGLNISSTLAPITVRVRDAFNNELPTATTNVTMALASPADPTTLKGTMTRAAVGGVATFNDLRVNRAGIDYTLQASAAGFATAARSATFSVVGSTVNAGAVTTCGLATGGLAQCWGAGSDGQIGNGVTGANQLSPIAVTGGLTFAQVFAGHASSCGLTAAGVAYCWGENTYGQIGDGTLGVGATRTTPAPSPVAGGLTFGTIAIGQIHTCALTLTGAAYCWGLNESTSFGNGTTANSATPTPVSGGLTFATITSTFLTTCGLTVAGKAYCWGSNAAGQIGDGTTTDRDVPTAVSGGLTFVALHSAGITTCGIVSGGQAYCWGGNTGGQVGDGTTTSPRTAPTPVSGGLSFVTINGRNGANCALTQSGAAYCWGSNSGGQIGDGTTTNRSVPTAVSGGLSFVSITNGQQYACGVTAAGATYCWGANIRGQLGDGTTTQRLGPVLVSGGLTFSSVFGSVRARD